MSTVSRRGVLAWAAGGVLAGLSGCTLPGVPGGSPAAPAAGTRSATGATPTASTAEIVYTNMGGPTGKELVKTVLGSAGITALDDFMASLDKFNAAQDPAKTGLVDRLAPAASKRYDEVATNANFRAAYPGKADRGARETAFSVLRDQVTSTDPHFPGSTILMELELMKTDPERAWLQARRDRYTGLFNDVTVRSTAAKDFPGVYPATLRARGARYNNPKADLIYVVTHNPAFKMLTAGHCGVRVELEGRVWFLEKLGVGRPYQLTRFPDDAALKAELLGRPEYRMHGAEPPQLLRNATTW